MVVFIGFGRLGKSTDTGFGGGSWLSGFTHSGSVFVSAGKTG